MELVIHVSIVVGADQHLQMGLVLVGHRFLCLESRLEGTCLVRVQELTDLFEGHRLDIGREMVLANPTLLG